MQQPPPAFDFQQLLASGDILSGTRLVPPRIVMPLRHAMLRDGLLKSYIITNSHRCSSASSGPHKMRRGQQVMQVAPFDIGFASFFDTGFAFRCPFESFCFPPTKRAGAASWLRRTRFLLPASSLLSRAMVKKKHVKRHTSHVTRHTSHITHHASHVTRHTSHVTRHTSHVTRHTHPSPSPAVIQLLHRQGVSHLGCRCLLSTSITLSVVEFCC
jgi:hypothetical protein